MNLDKKLYPRSLVERHAAVYGDPFEAMARRNNACSTHRMIREKLWNWFMGGIVVAILVAILLFWLLISKLPIDDVGYRIFLAGVLGVAPMAVLVNYWSSKVVKTNSVFDAEHDKIMERTEHAKDFFMWVDCLLDLHPELKGSDPTIGDLYGLAHDWLKKQGEHVRSVAAKGDSPIEYLCDSYVRFQGHFRCYHALHIVEGSPSRYGPFPESAKS